jgi:sec-independent protein translocase protein TatA
VFRGLFEGWTPVIIIVIIVLLFGAPKLPGLARSLGQSMRIFRGEMKTMKDEKKDAAAAAEAGGSRSGSTRAVAGKAPVKSAAGKSAPATAAKSSARATATTRKPAEKKPSA